MNTIIGIDLGTTNSVAAYLADDGPCIIPNALGEALTPSVVGIDPGGKLLVGRAAKDFQVLHPDRCASLFKRHMGSDWTVRLAGRTFTPQQLSSLILRALKEDAEAYFGHAIERAVITVPAYFNDHQRKATLHAGQIAGFQVERIFNEPTAAALAYGYHESREEKTLLIFDLGGGTFDVSVVELFEGAIEVRASSGENFLGGEDFTRSMAARVLEMRGLTFERAELETPALVARLIQQCEQVKCQLSRVDSAAVRVPDKYGDLQESAPEVTLTRAQVEQWCQATLARVELPLRRVLGDAKLKRTDIHEVLLVGGATRMPMVRNLVTHLMGKAPQCRLNPDEVVALGAAIQAGLFARNQSVDDLVVTDVAPFTLGIEVCKELGLDMQAGYFLPIIHRNTTIPVSRVQEVSPVEMNQTMVAVKIYQGESRRVEQNLLLGEFKVQGIPLGAAEERRIAVRFTYDLNGVLEVEATIVANGTKATHVVTRYAKGMSQRQIDEAVRDLQRLKTHPREEAVNRTLIQRAERIYQELPMLQREVLSRLLDQLESALALQEPKLIDQHRQALLDFLESIDAGGPDADPEDGDDGSK